MEQESTEIWHKPMQSPAIILEKVQEALKDAPEDVELKFVLHGIGAKRYNFISKVLAIGFGESQEEIAKYLMRAGVEKEIERIMKAMKYLEDIGVSDET
jgi:molybdopterin/thiamine biosynthesis adenylyltransferase